MTSPDFDFFSRVISDFLLLSIGKLPGLMVVSELGVGNDKSSSGGSGVELETEEVHLIEKWNFLVGEQLWRRKFDGFFEVCGI